MRFAGRVGRMPGAEQRFVGVDVSNADDQVIVHQRQLDRGAAFTRRAMQIVGVELRGKRLGAEPGEQRVRRCGLRRPEYRAEASRVVIAQHHTVAELDVDVIVGLLGRPVAVYAQASGHSQMHDERICANSEQ